VGLAVGISFLVLFLLAVGVAVGVIYCNRGPASTQSLNETLNANRPGLGSNYPMLGAVAGLCLALLFAIVIPASPTLYTMSSGSSSADIGIWTTVTCMSAPEMDEICFATDTADMWEGVDNDCGKALVNKMKTCQAFSILGVFGVFGAITLLFAPVPWLVPAAAAAFASFSYLVLFAVAASIYHGEPSADADCGVDGPNNDDLGYGGSFGLAVTNWIICTVAAVLIVVGAIFFQDAAPSTGRAGRAAGGFNRSNTMDPSLNQSNTAPMTTNAAYEAPA